MACIGRTYSLLTTPYSLLPTHYSPFPTPYSLLPTPYSLLTTPYSLLTTHWTSEQTAGRSKGRDIACAMYDTDDDECVRIVSVVDRVFAGESHAQTRRELIARCTRSREVAEVLTVFCDAVKKPCGDGVGCLARDISEDFGEIGFRAIS
jgi:hypothetical protein